MSESTENKELNVGELVEFFEKYLCANPQRRMASKALRSFVSSLDEDYKESPTPIETLITDWLVGLRIREISFNTAISYMKALSGLYSKAAGAGIAPKTEIFKDLMTRLRDNGDIFWNAGVTGTDFRKLTEYTKRVASGAHSNHSGDFILIISLLTGALPVEEVAGMKFDDISGKDEAFGRIAEEIHTDSRRKYLFAVNRSNRTKNQLRKETESAVSYALKNNGIRMFGSVDDTIRSYWAYAAIRAGLNPHTVIGFSATTPSGLPVLKLCGPGGPEVNRDKRDVIQAVNRLFTSDPKRWYAMHLRRRVTFDDLERRFAAADKKGLRPELFYPSEEISRRVGRKIVFEEKPVIRDIVFFRSRLSDMTSLFSLIGDLAWCYKEDRKGRAYSAISQSSFDSFQEAVGKFTEQYCQTHSLNSTLKKGDEVMIVSGPLKDSKAEILKVADETPEGIVSYLLKVFNDLTENFRATVTNRQIQKIADNTDKS